MIDIATGAAFRWRRQRAGKPYWQTTVDATPIGIVPQAKYALLFPNFQAFHRDIAVSCSGEPNT